MYEDWLKQQVDTRPHGTKGQLAEHMGIDGSKLSKTLAGKRELTARELQLAIEFLGVAPGSLVPATAPDRMVPIVGLAGAGPDGSVLFSEGQGNYGEVPAPPDAADTVEALEVRGDSMHGLANDGWIIFYEERTEPREEYMGEPCVCWLENGHVLVKVPEPTLHPGLFNLTSTNAPTIRGVVVNSMAPVTSILPRRAAQRYVRRNPNQSVTDIPNGRAAAPRSR